MTAENVSNRQRFYITTAIAYPNGAPHIGHAYEAIATDALARFQRLDGKDVFFLTGTDEHGLKMVQTAEKEGMAVADLAARNMLPHDWRRVIRLALFLCPTLVMNLRAGAGSHNPASSLIGFSVAVMAGSEPVAGEDVVTAFLDVISP